jgi:O-acetyl-ADP-ribose deacetylase (regulator of RNase III)
MTRVRSTVSFGEKLALELLVAEDAPPLSQALVVPQDVNLILGDVEPVLEEAVVEEVQHSALRFRPRRLGSVLVTRPQQEGQPLLLQAIVYDFDRVPPATAEAVFESLVGCFEEARQRGLGRIAFRPLGTSHGGLPAEAFLRLLTQACYSAAEMGTSLKRVSLLIPSPRELERYHALLRAIVERS